MNSLLQRTLSGFIYVALFVGAILYSKESYIFLTTIFAAICIWEFSRLIHFKNILPYLLLPLVVYSTVFYLSDKRTFLLLIITLLASIRLIYFLYKKKAIISNSFLDKLDLVIRYILLPFTFLILIPFVKGTYNPKILMGILVLIWVNDSFAFLVGKNFGKRKLFPSVSPKKTIEGFVGGFVFSLIAAFFIAKYTQVFSFFNWMIIATIVSTIGTIGDLVESKFKRQANIKDSGKIMPGHGGLLDRLDSLFFAAPFVYLYIHFII